MNDNNDNEYDCSVSWISSSYNSDYVFCVDSHANNTNTNITNNTNSTDIEQQHDDDIHMVSIY